MLRPNCRSDLPRMAFVGRIIAVRVWARGNAIRMIDLPHSLAALLREHAGGKSGYLFTTSTGRPIGQRNLLRALHFVAGDIGLHAFRRLRTDTLRRAQVPEDLIKLWLGHAPTTVTDLYAQDLQQDAAWRREWCLSLRCQQTWATVGYKLLWRTARR